MKSPLWLAILFVNPAAWCQQVEPSERPVDHFQVEGASRLAALAKLGALTNTTLLVEIDRLQFMQMPVFVTDSHSTVGALIRRIIGKQGLYTIRNEGALLIIAGAKVRNRVLDLPLGHFTFKGSAISSLHPLLAYSIRVATGCRVQGYGWAGPAMDLNIPAIDLSHATFEKVVARVAEAPEASMWIVEPESSSTGCIDDPASHWQVGLYGFGRLAGCQSPFQASVGPSFVAPFLPEHSFPGDCRMSLSPTGSDISPPHQ
ncbi:hypothetical protein RBB75_20870 (plasmid) [Tunturibacter empetritectus]|uniref:Uncharacterized protein n=1 Tax=Tunturiibacter empetritectus TaxID=3069691 RepID=A0AAU7ZIQ4_9BACT